MKEKDHIEKFIEAKLAEKEFVFEDQYWEEALSSISQWDNQKRKRRLIFWIWGFGFLFGVLGLAGVLVIGEKWDSPVSIHTSAQPPVHIEKKAKEAPAVPYTSIQKTDKETPETNKTDSGNTPANALLSNSNTGVSPGPGLAANRNKRQSEATPIENRDEGNDFASEPLTGRAFPGAKTSLPAETNPVDAAAAPQKESQVIFPKKKLRVKRRPVDLDVIDPSDEAFVYADIDVTRLKRIHPKRSLHWHIHAGLNIYREFENGQEDRSWIASPEAGLRISYPLWPKFRFSSGLEYFSRQGINRTKSTFTTQYDFIERREDIDVTPIRLHYVKLPIELQYQVTRKHRIGAGINPVWMVAARSEVSTTESTTLGQGAPQLAREYGYTKGLSPWDVQLSVGYDVAIAPRLELGARYYYGLRDLADDAHFEVIATERQQRILFHLIYTLK